MLPNRKDICNLPTADRLSFRFFSSPNDSSSSQNVEEDLLEQIALIEDGSFPTGDRWQKSSIEEILKNEAGEALLAFCPEGATIGYALYYIILPQVEVLRFAVLSSYQRLGIGTRLFDSLLNRVAHSAVDEIQLEVRSSNQSGLSFYEKIGFSLVGHRVAYYPPRSSGSSPDDALLLRFRCRKTPEV